MTAVAAGTTDHGSMDGRSDDDHTQYLLVSGSRAMTGNLTARAIYPDTNELRDLGQAAVRWNRLFTKQTISVNLSGTDLGTASYATNASLFGRVHNAGGGGTCHMQASGSGSFASGHVLKNGVGAGTCRVTSSGNGSFSFGFAYQNATGKDSLIQANGHGAFTFGFAKNGSIMSTTNGTFAGGYARDTGSLISAGGLGSHATGQATNGSTISASAHGTCATGFCNGAAGNIQAGQAGSAARGMADGQEIKSSSSAAWASGYAAEGYDILASGLASFASGRAQSADIVASGHGSFQWGPGTNSTHQSMQIGANIMLDPATGIGIKNGLDMRLWDSGSSNYVGFVAPALTANQIWTLPAADGTVDKVVKTNGAGELDFVHMTGAVLEAADNIGALTGNDNYLDLHNGKVMDATLGHPQCRAGSIVGIAGSANITTFTGGDEVQCEARINGVVALTVVGSISATGIFTQSAIQARGVDTFSANDHIQMSMSTVSGAPIWEYPSITVEVVYD